MNQKKKDNELVELLSHDIRNPLVIVLGQAECAIDKCLNTNEEVRNHLEKILRAGNHINRILDLVRDLRALELGKKVIHLEPISILPAIEEARFIFEKNLEDKQLVLEVQTTLENPIVMAEKTSLEHQVLNNLISNAIKFSPRKGKILINISEPKGKVKVEIIDQGIGIPKNIINNIFEPNLKTNRKGTEGEVGTGFGMPLVKKYMDFYQGEINISSKDIETSKKDHGTVITLLLNTPQEEAA